MDLTYDITPIGIVALATLSVIYGLALAFIGDVRIGYEWLITAVAAFIAAFIASEYLAMQSFEPLWEGIAVVPAIVAGVLVGFVADLIARFATGGSLTQGPRAI
jgi:hypothetical protein